MRGFAASVVILDRRGPKPATEEEEATFITQSMVVINSLFYSTSGGKMGCVVPQLAVLECSDSPHGGGQSCVRFLYSSANQSIDTSSFEVLKDILLKKMTGSSSSGGGEGQEEEAPGVAMSRCPLTMCLMRSLSFLNIGGCPGGEAAGVAAWGRTPIVILRERPLQLLVDPVRQDAFLVGKKRLRSHTSGAAGEEEETTGTDDVLEFSAAELVEEQSMGRAGFLTTALARGVTVSLCGGGPKKGLGSGKSEEEGGSPLREFSSPLGSQGEARYLLDVVNQTKGCYSPTVLNFHALAYLMVPHPQGQPPSSSAFSTALGHANVASLEQSLTVVLADNEEDDAVPCTPTTAAVKLGQQASTLSQGGATRSKRGEDDAARFVLKVCSQCLKTVRGGAKCGYCF